MRGLGSPGHERPRVLMTADAVGGVFSFVVSLARGLSSRGIDTAVACMGPAPVREQRAELETIPGVTLAHFDGALEWMDEPWADVDRAGRWLLELERRHAPDIVHLNGYCHAALPWSVPALVTAHSCVLSWWQAVHGEPAPARYAEYRTRVKTGLDAAACVVSPSHAMSRAVREGYAPSAPLLVIENGLDPSGFEPAEKQPLFLAAGRFWDRAKNLERLAAVAPELPWPLLVAGDGGSDLAQRPNLKQLGVLPRRELHEWLARAAVFVHPARYEPFGLSVLEAAASGCALVLGDIPSLRELWADAALYVAPADPAELLAACRRLAADAGERARLGERARQRARRYDLRRMVERYVDAYAILAAPASTSRARAARPRRALHLQAAGEHHPSEVRGAESGR